MIRQQKNEANASDREAQYDERAQKVAGSKIVIASILSKTVDTFRGMKSRAVFYASRQISSQKERDFVKSHYDDIKSAVFHLDLHEYGGKQPLPYSPDQRGYHRK